MPSPPTPTSEQQQIYVAVWAKAVDTQMHFNEMSVRSRQFGLAFVAAALGVAIVLLGHNEEFSIWVPLLCGFQLSSTVLIILSTIFALWGVRLLDLNVYHRMLRGSVTFGEDFEEHYMKQIFSLEKGMTQTISHYSRHSDAGQSAKEDGKYSYYGSNRKTAEDKIRGFYNFCILSMATSATILFFITAHFGHPPHQP